MASNATGNAEIQVSRLVAEQMTDPSITVLPTGGWIAVWGADNEGDVEFAHTVFQRFDAAGNPVGAETQVGDPEVFYYNQTVLPLSDGGWLVIHDGGDIVQQRFDAAGNAVGGESQVNTTSGDLRGTKATALEDGGWVVGWNGISFNEQVFQQVFDAEGNAVGGEVRVNTTTSGRNFFSDIEALPDGGWVVVWERGGGIGNVEQQRFDANGDPVGGETQVNTSAGGPNSNPTVTALADGGWVVTWADPDGDQTGIFQQRYDSNGDAVGSQTGVNTTTAGFQITAGVTALPDGGWVVVWQSGGNQDGSGSGVYMQRFDANGGAVGTETLVNVTTAGNQSEASVTALDGVGWVVTWVSTDPVTFDEVVMQRVFAADIDGTDSDDVIDGTVFDEAIFGLDGDDTINGGNGDDTIQGGAGADDMDGGDGTDTLSYAGSAQGVSVSLEDGTGTDGDAEGDTFQNIENLTGSAHGDTLEGTTGVNVIKGGAGNDTLIGRGGADSLEGGDGNDTFDFLPTDNVSGAVFDGGAGEDRLRLRTAGEGANVYDLTGVTLTSIEEIEFLADGGEFTQHTKTASLLASQIVGGGLSDTLLIDGNDSSNSEDLISIAMGDATSLDLSGWTFQQWGTVAFFGDGEVIAITGDDDAETITGSSERDVIEGGGGADIIDGGGGSDTASYAGSTIAVAINLDAGTANGGDADGDSLANIENLIGSANADTLTGDDGDNVLEGGAGDDVIDGGDGSDTASYAGASGAVTVDLEAGTATGAAGNDTLTSIENVIGSDHDDVISDQDDAVDNIIDGGVGDDRLIKNSGTNINGTETWIGGAGTDTFVFAGTQGVNDVVDLSLGMLTFEGNLRSALTGIENVEVLGGAGIVGDDQDNVLTAIGDFDNVISGGDGADIITGGGGDDDLSGGEGDDRFIWNDGDGSDTVNGGAGTDTVKVNLSDGVTGDVVTLSSSSGSNLERTDFDPFTLSTEGVERFEINGQGGDDEIDASNARSFVTLDGGDGNDILRGGIFNSTIRGGAGADQMFGGGGTANMLDYSGSSAAVEVDLATGLAAGGDAEGDTFDNKFFGIIGSDHNDVLRGRLTNVKEQLFGGAGNDTLVGGDGEDQLFGGDGDDLLIDGGRGDLLDGGDGIDTMSVENKTTSMTIDLAAGTGTNGTTIVNVENVIGTTKADTITGNDVANVLEGRGGDDTLDGGAGADRLIGGTGNDTYHVDNTADTIVELFDEGNDTVISSVDYALRDQSQNLETLTLTGTALLGTGNGLANTITGNAENNTLNGAFGDDTLIGGAGNDTFLDDDGADRMVGGLGDDTYHVDNAGDTIEELFDQGTDTVISSISFSLRDQSQNLENLTLTGTALFGTGNGIANTITGNAENNTLNGAFGDDTLIGGAGNDTFLDDDGADRMVGGLGDDTYFVDNVGDKTIEAAGEGTDTVNSSVNYFLWDQSQHIENLTLTGSGDINAGGNALANVITGNSGNNDLNGGANADRMVGGLGNDTYHVDNIGDKTIELADGGTDTVVSSISFELWQQNQFLENLTLVGTGNLNGTGNALANTITGNDGNNALNGGLGADRMVGGKGNDTYRVDNTGDTTIELAGEGTDTVNSSVNYFLWNQSQHIENLTLIGTANLNAGGNRLANTITGNSGNNDLNGGANTDRMIGGLGDDTYHVDNTGDKTIELAGEGTDTVNSSVNYFLWDQSQHIENLTLTGTANINAGGNALANTITGNSGNNDLNGGANADRMIGGRGNDTYHVDNTGDTIVELFDEGNDTVISGVDYALRDQSQNLENLTLTGTAVSGTGNGLANTITGNAGNNTLNGAFGNDTLIGGAGNDIFRDDAGNDIFTGGAGADTFFFLGAGESDRITDFEDGIDTITIGLGVNSFDDITVTDSGADTILSFGSNTVTLENFDHTLVTSDDFSFV